MSERKCPFCGATIQSHFKYCPKCGGNIPGAETGTTDRELFGITARMMNGEFADFTRFCELTRDMVCSCVRLHGVPEADIEDVCQNVYIDVWQSVSRLSDARAVKGWIKKIAANKSIDFMRLDSRYNRGRVEMPESEDFDEDAIDSMIADDSYTPEEVVMSGEEQEITRRVLEEAFESLPEDKRAILTVRFLDGMKIKDIAATLDMNENTVKTRIRRSAASLDVEIKRIQKRDGVKLRSVGVIPLLVAFFAISMERNKMSAQAAEALLSGLHKSIPGAFTAQGASSGAAAGADARAAAGVAAKTVGVKTVAIVAAVAVAGGAAAGVAGRSVYLSRNTVAEEPVEEIAEEIEEEPEIIEEEPIEEEIAREEPIEEVEEEVVEEPVEEEPDTDSDEYWEGVYADVIDQFSAYHMGEISDDAMIGWIRSMGGLWTDSSDDLFIMQKSYDWGYAFYDINGDGIKEFILCKFFNESVTDILAIWTMNGDNPVCSYVGLSEWAKIYDNVVYFGALGESVGAYCDIDSDGMLQPLLILEWPTEAEPIYMCVDDASALSSLKGVAPGDYLINVRGSDWKNITSGEYDQYASRFGNDITDEMEWIALY